MPRYRFADLTVEYSPKYGRLKRSSQPYLDSVSDNPDISIYLTDEYLDRLDRRFTGMSREECEYFFLGQRFYHRLIEFGGMMLHSSAVAVDGETYLFTAQSGGGKSTHTALWQQYFSADRAKIINDDKPAIRKLGGKYFAYGTPFSGLSDLNLNMRVPLKAICILEKGAANEIERIDPKDEIFFFLSQTVRPTQQKQLDQLLSFLDDMLRCVPVYKMRCNMDRQAAVMAYNMMK